ncbi:hypothetical protein K0T92_12060 [Paenibacillus oenotherae]|uniref:Methyl-accepting transducer domain-containing protein n=1 Tax=Paenibacillus oenotherae TaxID=1435645 RepID=A0ABS7D6H9_9BACL|nr:methyl-accepting chemotaxis protein [Paenibacillus oenotherae]MBW7475485.1 hypothetical protein [Paenibacillus oenotherae]
MSRMEEIFLQRNRLVGIIFWFIVAACSVSLMMKFTIRDAIVLAGVTVISVVIHMANKKQKLIKVMPFMLMVVSISIGGSNTADGAFFTTLMIGMVLLLMYPDYKITLINGVAAMVLVNIQLAMGNAVSPDPNRLTEIISTEIIVLLVYGCAIVVARLNQKLLVQAEQRTDEAKEAGEQNKRLLQQIRESSEILASYSLKLRNSVETTSSLTKEVTIGFGEVAKGVEAQAASVSDISDSVSHTGQNIAIVADSASIMKQLSIHTADYTEQGRDQVVQLTEQIIQVDGNMETLVQSMDQLNRQSRQITGMLTTVTDIAAQTNLLALNAAIEAARAGEQGRGFAVVSNEVRKLAENSRSAVEEIRAIVTDIENTCDSLTKQVIENKTAIDSSRLSVIRSKELLEQIGSNTQDVVRQAVEVGDTTVLLRQASNIIVDEVSTISSVTEQSSASVEQILASMEEQRQMVDMIVNSFNDLDGLIVQLNVLAQNNSNT